MVFLLALTLVAIFPVSMDVLELLATIRYLLFPVMAMIAFTSTLPDRLTLLSVSEYVGASLAVMFAGYGVNLVFRKILSF